MYLVTKGKIEKYYMRDITSIETRLVCPCCNMGFIRISEELESEFTVPNPNIIYMPTNYPKCTNCNTKFVISIDKTLKIRIEKI